MRAWELGGLMDNLVKTFNAEVKAIISHNQTYSLDTGNGILKIEAGNTNQDQKYCGWWDHDHSQIVYGETPYEVYSDLSGSERCGSN